MEGGIRKGGGKDGRRDENVVCSECCGEVSRVGGSLCVLLSKVGMCMSIG